MNRLISRAKRRLAGEEAGSALVLAMAFVMVFSILIGVMMSFADTSLRLTGAIRDKDGRTYSADGAVESAIGNIRYDNSLGRDPTLGGGCPSLATTVNATPMTVVCEGKPGSGQVLPGGINNSSNRPEQALLVLAQDTGGSLIPNEGLTVQTGELIVRGGMHSNGCIDTKTSGGCDAPSGTGQVTVIGSANAHGNCAGATSLTATVSIQCANRNPPAAAIKNDPGYALSDAPPPGGTPNTACPAGWIKTMSPGIYRDAGALSSLVSCKSNLVVWFQPGTYVFDFDNAGTPCAGAGDNSCRWTIGNSGNLNIVGGTPPSVTDPNFWSPLSLVRPACFPFPGQVCNPDPNPEKGACVRPSDRPSEAVDGVKFVFEGESRVLLESGARIELCPSSVASNDQQQIVIHGLRNAVGGGGTAGTSTLTAAATPDAPIVSPGTAWSSSGSSPSNGVTINVASGGSCSNATCAYHGGGPAGAGWSASITTGNVTDTPAIPAGATIDSVTLRFGRQADNGSGSGSTSSRFTSVVPGFFSGSTWYDCPNQVPTNQNYSVATCTPNGMPTGSSLLSALQDASQFRLQVTASNARAPIMRFDGIQMVVAYSFPTDFDPQSGCVVAPAASGGCPFISQQGTTTNVDSAFHGTVYVPGAWLDVSINNYAHQQFARGAVARHASVKVTGSAQNRGAFSLPEDSGANADRLVLFTAYENGDPALPRLRALVRFDDCNLPSCVVNTPGHAVEIQRWSVI